MECRRCTDSLTAYIDAELSEQESEEVSRHLANCPGCSEEHASLLYAFQLTNQLAPILAPSRLWNAIETELRGSTKMPRREGILLPFLKRRWIPLAAVTGALAASFAMFSVIPSQSPVEEQFSIFIERRERAFDRNRKLLRSAPAYDRYQLGRNPFMRVVSQTNENPFQE